MDYNALRHFADSWGLVFMMGFFVVAFIFVVMRPGAKKQARDAANIVFRDDER